MCWTRLTQLLTWLVVAFHVFVLITGWVLRLLFNDYFLKYLLHIYILKALLVALSSYLLNYALTLNQDIISPTSPILGHPLYLTQASRHFLYVYYKIAPQGILRLSSLPLALWIPCYGLYCNVECLFPKCVANPTPLSYLYFLFDESFVI